MAELDVARLQALADALTANNEAIAAKDVTVPEGTLFDDQAALIAAIQTGGGSSGASGSFTVAERVQSVTINMGAEYDHVIVAQRSGTGNQFDVDSSQYVFFAAGIRGYSSPLNNGVQGALVVVTSAYGGVGGAGSLNDSCTFSGSSVTFSGTGTASNRSAFSPNVTYDWLAW